MTTTRILAALAIALSSTTGAAAEDTVERKALQVFNDIQRSVLSYPNFTVFDDVKVSLGEDGTVIVGGRVTMAYKKDDIARRIARVEGVRDVRNEIAVLPVSTFDDDLRRRVARAIYGHPSFWHYAAMANPPIHIVVDRGRVTLSGVVANNVERMLARSLAVTFGAVSVKNELKTDAEAREDAEKL